MTLPDCAPGGPRPTIPAPRPHPPPGPAGPPAQGTEGGGVPSWQYRCPNPPTGSRTDRSGCLARFEEPAPGGPGAPPARPTLILQGVNFQAGRSVLTASSYAVLDQVAASPV